MFLNALIGSALAGKAKHSDVSVVSKGEPSYTCPMGFDLQGKKCLRYREDALIPVCEQGLLQGGKDAICLMTDAPRRVCPEGFVEDGQGCIAWDTVNPLTRCPPHFELVTGKKKEVFCEKPVKVPGAFVCPQGTVEDGKGCVSYQYISPNWECPMGTVMEGHLCASYEEYDCSQPVFPGKKDHHKLRRLGKHKEDHIVELGKGQSMETIIEVARRCKRTNYAQAIATCAPGTYSEGKQCKVVERFDYQETNPILTYETADVDSYCPEMFQWCPDSKGKHSGFGGKKHSQCCQMHSAQWFHQCDVGYVLDGNQCVAYSHPVYVCKSGHKKSKKGNCQAVEYREPIVSWKAEYFCEGKDCGMKH